MNIKFLPLNIKEYGIYSLNVHLCNNARPYIWGFESWTNNNYEAKQNPFLFGLSHNINLNDSFKQKVYYRSDFYISIYIPIVCRFIDLCIRIRYLTI